VPGTYDREEMVPSAGHLNRVSPIDESLKRGGSPGVWREVLAGTPLSAGDPYRYHMCPSREEQHGGDGTCGEDNHFVLLVVYH